ncbi:MAG: Holliday junction branch migration protein RuvA [Solobacterium sp.]|nr:Holliday junction branch migration protein RuvA [Solobacterium sp.]
MIAFVKGEVVSYTVDTVVLNQNGIGYEIVYPHTNELHLHEEILIHTYMHVTENGITLFGFSSLEEKNFFIRMIGVKGVGPKTVINMLSSQGYDKIVVAIEAGSIDQLKKIPGIGDKSARQIILDVKGKLIPSTEKENTKKTQNYPSEVQDAIDALKNLGYKQGDLQNVVNIFIENPGLSVEEYLRLGLQYLGR